jgi:hypothetical protein
MGIIKSITRVRRKVTSEAGDYNGTDMINPPDDLHFLMAHRCLSDDREAEPWRGMHLCAACALLVILQSASGVVVMNSMGNRFG